MSEHHGGTESFLDKYWQIFVIGFAVLLVSIFASYGPTSTGVENGHTSTPTTHHTATKPEAASVKND